MCQQSESALNDDQCKDIARPKLRVVDPTNGKGAEVFSNFVPYPTIIERECSHTTTLSHTEAVDAPPFKAYQKATRVANMALEMFSNICRQPAIAEECLYS